MPIRGGGTSSEPMALMPPKRMAPPPRSFATDAHGCIMVRIPHGIHRMQGCGAMYALNGDLPSDRLKLVFLNGNGSTSRMYNSA